MAMFGEMHISAERFAEYIAELREFSATHRVPYGKPDDLIPLLETLRTSPAFAEDFGSMIRSIVLNEHFQASESELLTLVAIAWGGAKADEAMDHLPVVIKEIAKVIDGILRRGSSGMMMPAIREPEEPAKLPPPEDSAPKDRVETSLVATVPQQPQEPVESVPINKLPPIAPTPVPEQRAAIIETASIPEPVIAPEIPQPVQRIEDIPSPNLPVRLIPEAETPKEPQSTPVIFRSVEPEKPAPTRRLSPKLAEVIATALTGLVVALLLNTPLLPVYRTRVSVYLPSNAAGQPSPNSGHGSAPVSVTSLQDGRVAEEVAQRLLLRPHLNPILRQDAVSRGMRDLNMGGMEPILYANLVAETAQQVKVRRLEPDNLYEITCDSWNSQFATTFCNELIVVLQEQPAGTAAALPGSDSVRAIDAGTGPGIQVYPHWYLQGFIGLAIGALVGVLLGFVHRSPPEDV